MDRPSQLVARHTVPTIRRVPTRVRAYVSIPIFWYSVSLTGAYRAKPSDWSGLTMNEEPKHSWTRVLAVNSGGGSRGTCQVLGVLSIAER